MDAVKPDGARRLHLVPISQRAANELVTSWHRHNGPVRGDLFRVAAATQDGSIVAVGIAGRPVARHLQDGRTVEVTRVASSGAPNATSFLYRALARAALNLGYDRVITYTQADESGSSLRAAGFRVVASRPSRRGWSAPSRPREDARYQSVDRVLWEAS